jgi:hypothetical protein
MGTAGSRKKDIGMVHEERHMYATRWVTVLASLFCLIGIQGVRADTLIFNNSNYTGYVATPDLYNEFLDYGTSPGGRISKFVFGYSSPYAVTVWVRFYDNTDREGPGYTIREFAFGVPSTGDLVTAYEYVIPEKDRFELFSGDFGYSFEFSNSTSGIALATGGAGIDRYFWEYDELYEDFVLTYLNASWNFYFQVYTAPPIHEVTCDIQGYTFNDANGNGVWDAGEPALPGWDVYLDISGDGVHQTSEPNAVTDPNGFYRFEHMPSPATYRVREFSVNGWTQTVPGSAANFQYVIQTDPNHVYGPYNFGNTTFVPKYSGGNGTAADPYKISNGDDWDSIETHPEDHGKYFVMTSDIDLKDYPSAAFRKINYFSGVFDGQNYTLTDSKGVIGRGMFGQIESTGIVKNLKLTHLAMDFGWDYSGGLAGSNAGQLLNCHVRGTNLGIQQYVGGLVGYNVTTGIISHCSFEGSVSGDQDVGGLVGLNHNGAQILASYSRAEVTGRSLRMGLRTGGLVGSNNGGIVGNCYSVGPVTGNMTTGGFVGENVYSGKIYACYCVGRVNGNQYTGGFAGGSGLSETAGCFWNTDYGVPPYVGIGDTGGSIDDIQGKTTEQMRMKSMFAGANWDFATTWRICDGMNYPRLQWESRPVGDFGCPEGVELADLRVMANAWLKTGASVADIAPTTPDGKVNLSDFAALAAHWLVGVD